MAAEATAGLRWWWWWRRCRMVEGRHVLATFPNGGLTCWVGRFSPLHRGSHLSGSRASHHILDCCRPSHDTCGRCPFYQGPRRVGGAR